MVLQGQLFYKMLSLFQITPLPLSSLRVSLISKNQVQYSEPATLFHCLCSGICCHFCSSIKSKKFLVFKSQLQLCETFSDTTLYVRMTNHSLPPYCYYFILHYFYYNYHTVYLSLKYEWRFSDRRDQVILI